MYYKSKTDIYNKWNSEACCLSASASYGSDATSSDTNIVVFTPSFGTFGFCECIAWDPQNPGSSCAGEATAENLICPVQGAQKEMCEGAAYWDGLPVNCGTVSTTATTQVTTTTTTTTDSGLGCCVWDPNRGCENNEFCDSSKANCEGTCGGTWNPTTVSSTTTTVVTTTTVATTTTVVTTTAPSTTTRTGDFEAVDGGVDRVCRGASATDNNPAYFVVESCSAKKV